MGPEQIFVWESKGSDVESHSDDCQQLTSRSSRNRTGRREYLSAKRWKSFWLDKLLICKSRGLPVGISLRDRTVWPSFIRSLTNAIRVGTSCERTTDEEDVLPGPDQSARFVRRQLVGNRCFVIASRPHESSDRVSLEENASKQKDTDSVRTNHALA